MRLFWNDVTFFKRLKIETLIIVKIFLPMFIVSSFLWFFFITKDIELIELIILSFLSSGIVYTFINIFLQFSSANIPDSYNKYEKTFMYLGQFIFSSVGLYFAIKTFL
jgi:hypothetical protein